VAVVAVSAVMMMSLAHIEILLRCWLMRATLICGATRSARARDIPPAWTAIAANQVPAAGYSGNHREG
jgi:hypothetical protein